MRKSRFTEAQIMVVLRQAEGVLAVPELFCAHGISGATFYKWRAKFGGRDAAMMSQMKALEDGNRRLMRMFATQWRWTYNNERPNMGIGGLIPAMKLKMAT